MISLKKKIQAILVPRKVVSLTINFYNFFITSVYYNSEVYFGLYGEFFTRLAVIFQTTNRRIFILYYIMNNNNIRFTR